MSNNNPESIKIPKYLGTRVQMSLEFAYGDRFPRRHHEIVHPITDHEQAAYDVFVERWNSARAVWNSVVEFAEHNGWGNGVHGYEWDDAELYELKPKIEYIYDETEDEYRQRLADLVKHHEATGEWLEEPKPTFAEMITNQFIPSFYADILKTAVNKPSATFLRNPPEEKI